MNEKSFPLCNTVFDTESTCVPTTTSIQPLDAWDMTREGLGNLTPHLKPIQGQVAYHLVILLLDIHFPFRFIVNPFPLPIFMLSHCTLFWNRMKASVCLIQDKEKGWKFFKWKSLWWKRFILFNVQQYVCKHSLMDLCELETFFHSFFLLSACTCKAPISLRTKQVLPFVWIKKIPPNNKYIICPGVISATKESQSKVNGLCWGRGIWAKTWRASTKSSTDQCG